MINLTVSAVLTDIEGTTTDIAFVHKVLFPYARQHMTDYVMRNAEAAEVKTQLDVVARESQTARADLSSLCAVLIRWIDEDRKITPLKTLQGLIWETGYMRGDFRGHVYADAHAQLQRWHASGIPLYVYSSGSVAAQKLIYGHSDFGDLRPWFKDYFDTHIGGKREAASYAHLTKAIAYPANDILFLSDVVEELDAAAHAGMRCIQLVRDPNMNTGAHPVATTFNDLHLERTP